MTDPFHAPVDQASGLRRLFEKSPVALLAFASAARESEYKGDRVKVMMQLVADFTGAGRSVTLLDEHPAAGSIARAYGLSSRKDLKHVLHGDYPLDDVLFAPVPGVTLIPAPRAANMDFSIADEAALAGNLALLRSYSDYVMIDCVHHAQRALSPIARHADRLLLTTPPGGGALTATYALIKRVAREKPTLAISIVVVRAKDAAHARATYDTLQRVASNHLDARLHYGGAALTPGAQRLSLTPPTRTFAPEAGSDFTIRNGLFSGLEIGDSVV